MIFRNKKIDVITPNYARYANGGKVEVFSGGGSVTSGELLEDIEDIKVVLENDKSLSESERNQLNSVLEELLNKNRTLENPIISSDDLDEEQFDYTQKWLVNGNYFREFNEKVLGDIKIDTDRFKNEIRVVTGDIMEVDQIEVDDNFAQFILKDDSAVSVKKPKINELVDDPDNESFIEETLEESQKSIANKQFRDLESKEIQTTADIYKKLNQKISRDELRVYLWYKDYQGQRFSDEWYKIAGYDSYHEFTQKELREYIAKGILFYFNGEFLPKVIYLSGDIYGRISRIVKAGDNS